MDKYNSGKNPDGRRIRIQPLSGSPELLAKIPGQPPRGVFPADAPRPRPETPRREARPRKPSPGGRPRRKKLRVSAPRLIAASVIAVVVIGAALVFAMPAGREAVSGLFAGISGGLGSLGSPGGSGGSGGFASNGSSSFKGHTVVPMDDKSNFFFFNGGSYVFQLKDGELTEYLGVRDIGNDSDTNENPVRFGKNVFWLNGRIPTYFSTDSPGEIKELDFEASVMTYDEKNIYLLDKNEGKLYTLNPSSLETASVDMPYDLNNESTSIRHGWAYAAALDGTVYFTAADEGGDAYYTYAIDSATGESRELLPGRDGVLSGLSADESGFYFKGANAVCYLPHGGDEPEEILTYDDPRLAEDWGAYDVSSPDSIYLDGGYLYVSFLNKMPEGNVMYRLRPDGSGLTAINIPEEYANYASDGAGVVVKNGWINYNTGAFHLGRDGIDEEIYNDHPGYHYRKADIPYTDMETGGAAPPAQSERDEPSGAEEDVAGESEGGGSSDGDDSTNGDTADGGAEGEGFKDENASGEFPVEGEIFTAANGDYMEFFGIDPADPYQQPYCVISIYGIEKDYYWSAYTDESATNLGRGNNIGFAVRGSSKETDDFYATLDNEQKEFIVSLCNYPCLVREEGLIAMTAVTEEYSSSVTTKHYFFRSTQGDRNASSGAEDDTADENEGGGLLDGLLGGGGDGLSGVYVTETIRNRTLDFDNGVMHLSDGGMLMDLNYAVSGDEITFSRQGDLQGYYDTIATGIEESGGIINADGSLLINSSTYTKE